MYYLIRKCLFAFNPERSHRLALNALQLSYRLGLTRFFSQPPSSPRTVMGLNFPNPIGLAAGLDVNGDYIDALATLGFGFIEIGGVTPKPQIGNPSPWLFRLTEQEAIINRKGFANNGLDYMVNQLKQSQFKGILGINLAKNRETPIEQAADDYLICMRALWQYASFLTVNVSSPNTPGFRNMQKSDVLAPLLRTLKNEQAILAKQHNKYVPLVVKISPDLTDEEITEFAHVLLAEKIDGIIATNTTIDHSSIKNSPHANETGGLSGKPLQAQSTHVIKQLQIVLQSKIPIIACGGIHDVASLQEKMDAGASLFQILSGFIYHGPALINQLAKHFSR